MSFNKFYNDKNKGSKYSPIYNYCIYYSNNFSCSLSAFLVSEISKETFKNKSDKKLKRRITPFPFSPTGSFEPDITNIGIDLFDKE